MRLRPMRGSIVASLLTLAAIGAFAAPVSAQMHGAIFTTDDQFPWTTNKNLYDAKTDVYVNGGPRKIGSAGLPQGWYYVMVTNPSGSQVLGTSVANPDPARTDHLNPVPPIPPDIGGIPQPVNPLSKTPIYVDANEKFHTAVSLWDSVFQKSNGGPGTLPSQQDILNLLNQYPNSAFPGYVQGYRDTTNNGGEYKVWVSQSPDFPGGGTKTDNFKVDQPHQVAVRASKWRDSNGDGIWDDPPELPITGWEIRLYRKLNNGNWQLVATEFTIGGDVNFLITADGREYKVEEVIPAGQGWAATTPLFYTFFAAPPPAPDNLVFEFGNWRPIDICATKYRDSNGNGAINAGEQVIVGWEFELVDAGTMTVVQSGFTDATGEICFEVDNDSKQYILREVMPGGSPAWVATSPVSGQFNVTANAPQDFNFLNWRPIELCAFKYRDRNGNGVLNAPTDTPIAGWTIQLRRTVGDTLAQSGQTDALGKICFTVDADGTSYKLVEVIPVANPAWVCTAPNAQGQFLNVLATTSQNFTFLNWQPMQLLAEKFRDRNGDGVKNNTDSPLQGWTITISPGLPGNPGNQNVKVTDAGGQVAFTVDGDGSTVHTITETIPVANPNWVATLGPSFQRIATVNPVQTKVLFLNWQPMQLLAEKFRDRNGDGVKNNTDSPLSGWTITISPGRPGNPGGSNVKVTDAGGQVAFTVDGDGSTVHTITETIPVANPAWVATLGPSFQRTATVNPAQTKVLFLNWQPMQLLAEKFRDRNGDGIKNFTDSALPGWTITISPGLPGNPGGANVKVTDAGGQVAFTVDGDGSTVHTITETIPVANPAWVATLGPSFQRTATVNPAQTKVLFLNWQPMNLLAEKFRDRNGDGVKNFTDSALAGWTITISPGRPGNPGGSNVKVTDAGGQVSFQVDGDGVTVHTITETIPVANPAWVATLGPSFQRTATVNPAQTKVLFLNWQPMQLLAEKFRDKNGNGQKDLGELPIQGWTITISPGLPGNPGGANSKVTNAQGQVSFTVDGDGSTVHTITESIPNVSPPWVATTLTSFQRIATVNPAQTKVTFLNWRPVKMRGQKFYDTDADGIKDAGEPPIQGWKILIYKGLAVGTPVGQGFTDANGIFEITVDFEGTNYTIVEVLPPPSGVVDAWVNTTPLSVLISDANVVNTVTFLNYAFGYKHINGFGKTKGWWQTQNPNGTQNLYDCYPDWVAPINALNLVNSNGSPFNITAVTMETARVQIGDWINGPALGNAKYIMSMQLATFVLNMYCGPIKDIITQAGGQDKVFVNWDGGFVALDDFVALADALLSNPASSDEDVLEMSNFIDAMNNNHTPGGPGSVISLYYEDILPPIPAFVYP